ncbi:hypothetical protein FRB90_011859 [Tulasnella sp. 427]|nr:hypothetical protein FRB90_011859 [Tulasnella sp. 427]
MSKRRASGIPGTAPATKRVQLPSFGAENEYDKQIPGSSAQPSSALSTRPSTSEDVPSLVSISLRAFAESLLALYENEQSQTRTRRQLKALPDFVLTRLFSVLRQERPTYLNHPMLVAYFIRGAEVTLTGELTGVSNNTLHAIPDKCPDLVHLELRDLTKPSDDVLSSVISELPALETLILRGCTKAGAKTVDAASQCSKLKVLNLNYTTPSAGSIGTLILACPKLEVVKLAGITKLLKSLKLRLVSVIDSALTNLLSLTPKLERLDISSTQVRSISCLSLVPNLRKLSISSCPINLTRAELRKIPVLEHLEVLNIGAIGVNNSPTLMDEGLYALTDLLEPLERLQSVSLVGNSKLGLTSKKGKGALADFVCRMLNLGGVPNLASQDLRGLLTGPEDDQSSDVNPTPSPAPRLESLTLSNTSVDNEAAVYISTCPSLEALALENTRFTSCVVFERTMVVYEGLFTILDACDQLTSLDLTSCRGIHVTDRRRFFEVWEEARAGQNVQADARDLDEENGRTRRRTRRDRM